MLRVDMDNCVIHIYHRAVLEAVKASLGDRSTMADIVRAQDSIIRALRRDAEALVTALLFSPIQERFSIVEIRDNLD